jgi:hypothetical protein
MLEMVFMTTASLLGKPCVLVILTAGADLLGSAARGTVPPRSDTRFPRFARLATPVDQLE